MAEMPREEALAKARQPGLYVLHTHPVWEQLISHAIANCTNRLSKYATPIGINPTEAHQSFKKLCRAGLHPEDRRDLWFVLSGGLLTVENRSNFLVAVH